MSFATSPTEVLLAVRLNLLRGLDRVAEHIEADTFHDVPSGKSSSPAQAGQLTLVLLSTVDAELSTRGVPCPS